MGDVEDIVRLLDLGADIKAADPVRCVSNERNLIIQKLCVVSRRFDLNRIGYVASLFCL